MGMNDNLFNIAQLLIFPNSERKKKEKKFALFLLKLYIRIVYFDRLKIKRKSYEYLCGNFDS